MKAFEKDWRQDLVGFLLESTSDAVIGLTLDGAVSSWNAGAETLFGFKAAEAIGQLASRFIKLADRDLARLAAGERIPPTEASGTGKDGHEFALNFSIAPVPGAGEAAAGALMIARGMKPMGSGLEHLQHLAEITQEAWWEEDLRTGQVRNSPRFCQMLGLDGSMMSYPLPVYLARIHPDDLPRLLDSFERAIREGTDYIETYRVRHASGHYIWVENRSRILARDANGKPTHVLGAMVDVTARKQVELALRTSEERYRQVADITQEAWWEEDIEASILTNSHRFCAILGRGEDILECTVAAYRELIHPDDRNHTRAAHDRAVYEGADYK